MVQPIKRQNMLSSCSDRCIAIWLLLWESFYDTMVENPPVTRANGDITSSMIQHE